MDRRTILALVLVVAVIFLTPRLFPGKPAIPRERPDSSALVQSSTAANSSDSPSAVSSASVEQSAAPVPAGGREVEVPPVIDTLAALGDTARFEVVARGAALERVVLKNWRALDRSGGSVQISGVRAPLLQFLGIVGTDTIHFERAPFSVVSRDMPRQGDLVLRGAVGGDTLRLSYRFAADSYLVHLQAQVSGRLSTNERGYIVLELPKTLRSFEADSIDDQRHLGFAYKPVRKDAKGIGFGKLKVDERQVIPGALEWVALKDKYFILGVIAADTVSPPLVEFSATGMPKAGRIATQASGSIVVRPQNGSFDLDIYAGPQQTQRLQAVGRDFENSNPYGNFLQPVVQPFAVLVMRILLWMRRTLDISYGWVLVIFGVVVRMVLWPLNQSAMRSSLRMQRIQPELSELQKRHKNDPQKLQTEMMRVYKEHGMSPFSMFSGCLPMLLPMPVLFALFFVFQNTIEFRGVSFLWLHDISQKDPFYILPIVMGISMYVLTWIGTRNTPPNPQTKMMGYVFPVMMTFLLGNLAAGLNLYYAVQNMAALPQQWMIANERARAAAKK